MGSPTGFPWPFRKSYEPARLSRIQDMGPPSPCWLPPRPAFGRRSDFSPHEKADSKKPAPHKAVPTVPIKVCTHLTAVRRGVATVKPATPESRSTPGMVRRTS